MVLLCLAGLIDTNLIDPKVPFSNVVSSLRGLQKMAKVLSDQESLSIHKNDLGRKLEVPMCKTQPCMVDIQR